MSTISQTRPSPASKYETFVEEQLVRARNRIRMLDLAAAGLGFLIVTLSYGLLMAVLDRLLSLPSLVRQAAFGLYLIGAVVYVGLTLGRVLFRRINPLYAAKQVEQVVPGAKNSVVNYLDLRDQDLPAPIRGAVSHRAAKDLARADLDQAISTWRTGWLGGILGGLFLGLVVLFFLGPPQFFSLLRRAFAPFTETMIATRTQISIMQPEGGNYTVSVGRAVPILASVFGRIPESNSSDALRLLYRHQPNDPYTERPLERGDSRNEWGTLVPAAEVQTGFWYKVAGGDAETPEYHVQVRSNPLVETVEVKYHYRPYLNWPDRTTNEPNLEELRGTEVILTARTNRAIGEGHLEFVGEGRSLSAEKVADEPRAVRFQFVLDKDGSYRIWFQSREGERNADPMPYTIRVKKDNPPRVEVTKLDPAPAQPARAGDKAAEPKDGEPVIELPANGLLKVEGVARDDYGIVGMKLRAEGDNVQFARTYREGKEFKLENGNFPLKLDYKDFVDLGRVKRKNGQPLQAGVEFECWLEATDNCDYPEANVGRSEHFKVRIKEPEKNPQTQQQQRRQAQEEQKKHNEQQDQNLQKESEQRKQEQQDNQDKDNPENKEEKKDNPDAQGASEPKPEQGDQPKNGEQPKSGDQPKNGEQPKNGHENQPQEGAGSQAKQEQGSGKSENAQDKADQQLKDQEKRLKEALDGKGQDKDGQQKNGGQKSDSQNAQGRQASTGQQPDAQPKPDQQPGAENRKGGQQGNPEQRPGQNGKPDQQGSDGPRSGAQNQPNPQVKDGQRAGSENNPGQKGSNDAKPSGQNQPDQPNNAGQKPDAANGPGKQGNEIQKPTADNANGKQGNGPQKPEAGNNPNQQPNPGQKPGPDNQPKPQGRDGQKPNAENGPGQKNIAGQNPNADKKDDQKAKDGQKAGAQNRANPQGKQGSNGGTEKQPGQPGNDGQKPDGGQKSGEQGSTGQQPSADTKDGQQKSGADTGSGQKENTSRKPSADGKPSQQGSAGEKAGTGNQPNPQSKDGQNGNTEKKSGDPGKDGQKPDGGQKSGEQGSAGQKPSADTKDGQKGADGQKSAAQNQPNQQGKNSGQNAGAEKKPAQQGSDGQKAGSETKPGQPANSGQKPDAANSSGQPKNGEGNKGENDRKPSIEELIKALKNGDAKVREDALNQLDKAKETVKDPNLRKAIDDACKECRGGQPGSKSGQSGQNAASANGQGQSSGQGEGAKGQKPEQNAQGKQGGQPSGQEGKDGQKSGPQGKGGQPNDQEGKNGENNGKQGQDGQGGQAAQGQGKGEPGGKPSTGNRPGGGAPQAADRHGPARGSSEPDPKGSEANPLYQQKPGDLQLEDFKKRVNKDVLKKANMTEEEYQKFLKAYEEMLKRKQPQAAAKDDKLIDPKLRGSDIGNLGPRRLNPTGKDDKVQRGGAALPPPEYREAYKEFTEKLNGLERSGGQK